MENGAQNDEERNQAPFKAYDVYVFSSSVFFFFFFFRNMAQIDSQ